MATKINNVMSLTNPNGVLCCSWLERQHISRTEQGKYVQSGWLMRIVPGVYRFANSQPTLYDSLAAVDEQVGLHYRVAASSALDLHGYAHYLSFGQSTAHIITPITDRLPNWMRSYEWDMKLKEYCSKVFDGTIGVTTVEHNGQTLKVSSPELAIMECLLLSHKGAELMDIYMLMESLTTLRATLVSQLLAACSSVKVKRLFLFMAEKAGHPWFRRLDLANVALGSGPRSFVKGGVKIAKYNIVIPKELAYYE